MSEFNDDRKQQDSGNEESSELELKPRSNAEPKGVMKHVVQDMGYKETDLIYEAFVTEEVQEYKEGFTIKTMIGAFFVAFIMTPAAIFLGLTTGVGGGSVQQIAGGGGIGPAAQWTTVILFMEVARRSFTTLTKQEMYVLYAMASMLAGGGPFTGFIWNQYLKQSPAAAGFGIAEDIPIWIVPPLGSEALLQRTFFHADWLPAIVLMLFSTITGQMTYIGAGYLVYKVTADIERLPFPHAPIAAQGATALAETTQKKETWRWRIFSIGAMVGLAYGCIYVLIPGVTGAIMSEPLQIIPIPFIDLTPNVGQIAPAAALAIATDLGAFLQGLIVPFYAVMANMCESMITNFVLNPYLYNLGILHSWRPGMDVMTTQLMNNLDFWMSIHVGSAIAVAIVGIITAIRYTMIAKNEERMGSEDSRRLSAVGRGDPPLLLAFALWFVSTSIVVYIAHMLVPGFPFWVLLVWGFVWSPFDTYISARMMGLIGRDINFPYIRQATFLLSGYKGVDIWFAPMPLYDHSQLSQHFKQIELTGTKFTSFYKLALFVLPINLVTSYIFWQFVWNMNPIPSAAYPFAQKVWPFQATMQLIWTTGTAQDPSQSWLFQAINATYIYWGLAGGLALWGITKLTRLPEMAFYGVVGGFGILPHQLIPQFVGALVNRFYFSRLVNPDKWRRYAMVLIAGYYAGMGLIAMISVGFTFIAKAVTQLPY